MRCHCICHIGGPQRLASFTRLVITECKSGGGRIRGGEVKTGMSRRSAASRLDKGHKETKWDQELRAILIRRTQKHACWLEGKKFKQI